VTSSARPGLAAKRSPLSELWLTVRHERALVALFDLGRQLGRQKSRDLRAARLDAFGVFATYALAIALSRGADRQQLTQSYAVSIAVFPGSFGHSERAGLVLGAALVAARRWLRLDD